jgi:hypothetical protein
VTPQQLKDLGLLSATMRDIENKMGLGLYPDNVILLGLIAAATRLLSDDT